MAEKIEIWANIDLYPEYQVSSFGRVKSLYYKKERILKQFKNKNWPYYYVTFGLYKDTFRVHRLVAKSFIPNPDNLPQVNHKDGNGLNNDVENLEWISASGNMLHSYGNGKHKPSFGNARLKKDDVLEIRRLCGEGVRKKDIAEKFKVHVTSIYDIHKRKVWSTI